MTDEQIVKALRLCADRGCYRCTEYGKEYCRETVASLAWDLIYRQQAEIERLKQEATELQLRKEMYRVTVDEVRAEAVREFAEKLKKWKYQSSDWSHGEHPFVVEETDIDELVMEMTEKEGGKG